LEKNEQSKSEKLHQQKLDAMKMKSKDAYDKVLDKGRTKKVKRKKSFTAEPNRFQQVSTQRQMEQ